MDREIGLSIAGLGFRLRAPEPLSVTENCLPFLTDLDRADFLVRYEPVEQLPDFTGEPIFRNVHFAVFHSGGTYVRSYFDPFGQPFAVSVCYPEKAMARVRYRPDWGHPFADTRTILSYGCFEQLLLSRERLILHASLVDTPYGGILFSGPSGIGKSTQAELWKRYGAGRIINGDRPILCRSENGWLGYGSPYAGSSGCHVNESTSVRAVVMLGQGTSCALHSLGIPKAFREIFGGVVMDTWNSRFVSQACDLITDLVSRVPVYHLNCTPDRNAVEILKETLRKGEK